MVFLLAFEGVGGYIFNGGGDYSVRGGRAAISAIGVVRSWCCWVGSGRVRLRGRRGGVGRRGRRCAVRGVRTAVQQRVQPAPTRTADP